jgi:general secretion pathway protein K
MRTRQRGFALLIVLWTVGFLALLGTQIVAAGRSDTRLSDNLKQEAVLAAAADGAIANVLFRMQAAGDAGWQADGVVRQLRVGTVVVLVRIDNENDRINVNTASAPLLRALIIGVGGAPALADRLAATILDWRTSGASPRPGGAKAADYLAAGRAFGPPGSPFQSVAELADVLGMPADLFARLEPHLTVLTDGDPDMSTRDPVVARALTDAAGVADDTGTGQQTAEALLRVNVTAIGPGAGRYSRVVVAAGDFQTSSPRVKILWQERGTPLTSTAVALRRIEPSK